MAEQRQAFRRGEEERLTDEQVRKLRELAARGYNAAVLGKRYGISQSQASRIVRRLIYREVT